MLVIFIVTIISKESIKRGNFIINHFDSLYYKCHKINACGGSYINLPFWIENKKATINHLNIHDNKCFPYANII